MMRVDSEQLNDETDENFLSRWSRRKQTSANVPVEAETVEEH